MPSDEDHILQRFIEEWERSVREGKPLSPREICTQHHEYLLLLEKHVAHRSDLESQKQTPIESPASWSEEQHNDRAFPSMLTANSTIVINRKLGSGGLGEVYVASDRSTGRDMAVKLLNSKAAAEKSCRDDFEFEARITCQLEHPNIVPVYVVGRTPDGKPFYAMRLISGRTFLVAISELHDVLMRQDSIRRESLQRTLLGQFVLACQAIAYAHDRGVVHRDIKPANIMLGRFGEVVVLDWGLAARIDRGDRAKSSGEQSVVLPTIDISEPVAPVRRISGTPAYMSPEQHDGATRIGSTSDVYGLGATLYHVLTGQPPYEGDYASIQSNVSLGKLMAPSRVRKGVPRALEAICLKAMSLDPADRYETALDLSREIENYLADEPVEAYHEPLIRKTWRWARRHRTLTQMAIGMLALLMLLAGSGTLLLRRVANEEFLARKTAVSLAAQLAANGVGLKVDYRWRILEFEAASFDMVNAMIAVDKQVVSAASDEQPSNRSSALGSLHNRETWLTVQSLLDQSVTVNRDAVAAESWFVCDVHGVQIARVPIADTIGESFAHRDYFHGNDHDLEIGQSTNPLTEVHRSSVYKSSTTGKLKVAFSGPIWTGKPGTPGRKCVGVIGMAFDVGTLFRQSESMSTENKGGSYVVTVVDLREDELDGSGRAGLVLENPEIHRELLQKGSENQPHRISPKLVAQIREGTTSFGNRGTFPNVNQIIENLPVPGMFLGGPNSNKISAIEPIMISGRPAHLSDIGWAVMVSER